MNKQNKTDVKNTSYKEITNSVRYRKLILILKILSAANILILLIIASLFYFNTENKRTFNKQILEIDRSISLKNFTEASNIIKIASERANTKNMALMIMKRGYKVSGNISKYNLLFDLSEKYFYRFKRDKRIKSVYLFSLLKTGRIEKFFEIFQNSKNNDLFSSDLLLEGYSKNLINNMNFSINSTLFEKFYKKEVLFNILQNPENPENYLKAYNKGNNKQLLNNLILLNLKKGSRDRALEYTVKRNIPDYLSALVYLDNERFFKSNSILNEISDNSSELTLIQGDLQMYLNRSEYSRIIYKNLMKSDPWFSSIPLINLIWLDYEKQKTINIDLFNNLLKKYPESRYNNILFYINLKNEAGTISNSIISDKNNDLDEYLITGNNNSRLLNLLWNIYNNSEYSADFKDYFAFYLYKNRYFSDLNILLEKKEYENSSTYYFFNSLLYILDNNFTDAEIMLNKYLEMHYNFEIIYDLALINIYYEKFSSALKYFNIITKNEYFMHNISKKRLSDIYFKTAYSHYKKKNYQISYKLLNKSISLDRGNIEPQFLLKDIKSKIVEPQ